MPKAEGGFDLDADVVGSQAGAVMRAMNDETPGAHRPQSGKAPGHPVGARDALNAERFCRRLAGSQLNQIAQPDFVRSVAEMNRHLPVPGIVLEGAGRIRGI
ncbi:MAG: hypothetical protein WA769_21480 [Pseudolabrys sp.]